VVLQNALLEGFSADSQRLPTGALSTASVQLAGINLGVLPLLTFRLGDFGHRRVEPAFLSH
jgi:branched-chain amino acid transport system permease protein